MKVKFIKKVGNAEDKKKPFNVGDEVDLSKKRAKKAIDKGYAVEVKEEKEPTKSTSKKIEEKTVKK